MSNIIFSKAEWNSLLKLVHAGEYPYLQILGNKLVAASKKLVLIRRLRRKVTSTPVFIHKKYLQFVSSPNPISIKVSSKKVKIKYSGSYGKIVVVEDAYTPVEDFPKISKLRKREIEQEDNHITFSLSRERLCQLLNCSTSPIITFTIHEDSIVTKWKGKKEMGYLSKVSVVD